MTRRELFLLLSGAMTAAPALHAQQKATPVIGFLGRGRPVRLYRMWPRSTGD
jgi:hypothetical protein